MSVEQLKANVISSSVLIVPPFMSIAIYLAKKNIRKQGELMEYEKVRKVFVSV